jgi:hypothetical protein
VVRPAMCWSGPRHGNRARAARLEDAMREAVRSA